MTLSITTVSITGYIASRTCFHVMQIVIMLIVVLPNVAIQSIVMLSVIVLSVGTQIAINKCHSP